MLFFYKKQNMYIQKQTLNEDKTIDLILQYGYDSTGVE